MASRTLSVTITGDARGAQGAFRDVEHGTDSLQTKLKNVGQSMMRTGALMTAGITLPLALLGKQAFNAASDFNESLDKVRIVFGENAGAIEKWSKTAATSMGMARQQALEAAGTFGNLFTALGLSGTAATSMSMELTQLAADLAAFNNITDVNEVLIALRAGLVGEAEPLRKFGVSLSAARVESEALSSGLVQAVGSHEDIARAQINLEKAALASAKATKEHGAESLEARDAAAALAAAETKLSEATKGKVPELTAAQKAQAAYNIIMKDTATAQGNFVATSAGAAGQAKILKAQFQDMQATLGQALIPIFLEVVDVLSKVGAWFQNLDPKWQKLIVYAGLAAAAIGPLTTALGGLLTVVGVLASPIVGIGLAMGALVAAAVLLYLKWDEVWNAVAKHPALLLILAPLGAILIPIIALVGAIKLVQANWETIWPILQRIVESVWSVLRVVFAAFDTAIRGVGVAAKWLGDRWAEAWPTIQSILEGAWSAMQVVFAALVGAYNALAETANWVLDVWSTVWSGATGALSAAWDAIQPILGFMEGMLRDVGRAAQIMLWVASEAFHGFVSAAGVLWRAVDGPLGAIKSVLDAIVGAARAVKNALDNIPGTGGIGDVGKIVGQRASGGPVMAGSAYLVGERGPEMFVPSVSGGIVPNHAFGGGNSYSISVQVAPGGNPADTGRAVVESIKAFERRAGSSWRN